MSNLLVVHGPPSTLKSLVNHLDPEGRFKAEWRLIPLGQNSALLDVRRGVADADGLKDAIFEGFAIDHEGENLILGGRGFHDWREKNGRSTAVTRLEFEGAYALIEWDDDHLRIQNDIFGLQPLCWSSVAGCNIISDSLWMIRTVRNWLGETNSLDRGVFNTRTWGHGLANAAMSDRSLIEGVQILPPGGLLQSDRARPETGFVHTQTPLRECFSEPPGPYATRLTLNVRQIQRLLMTLGELKELTIELGLSGGLDSRVILALVRSCPGLMEQIEVRTNLHESRRTDRVIASRLAAHCDFQIMTQPGPSTSSDGELQTVENPFGDWVLSDLGLFDMMYIRESYWTNPHRLSLGGHGAEIVKGTFVKPLRIMIDHAPLSIRSELDGLLTSTMRRLSVDTEASDAMQWFHLAFKSGIQNGRFITHAGFGIRPLIHRGLFAMAIDSDESDPGRKSILHDILILLDPEMAAMPFDEVKKNMRPAAVRKRRQSFSIDLQTAALTPYSIHGSTGNLRNSPPECFRQTVTSYRLLEGAYQEGLRDLLDRCFSIVDDPELKTFLEPVHARGVEALSATNAYLPSAGSSVAKLLSLDLVD